MVIDASALLAILFGEAGADELVQAILGAELRLLGAATFVEAAAVILTRKGPQGEIALDALLQRLDIQMVALTPDAARFARSAYARFGKSVGSPAILNFGDCLAYGVARAHDLPLLYRSDDFPQTDVQPAL